MIKIGLIVNPVAGIGGKAGLKGSDGAEIQACAKKMGAVSEAQQRTITALKEIAREKDNIELLTAPAEMGGDAARESGFSPVVIGNIHKNHTTAEDTIRIAKTMAGNNVSLLIFAGGDGTAINILNAVDSKIPVVGIPAGVKIHSGVYAINPRSAGQICLQFIQGNIKNTVQKEVMDIDENAFRAGSVQAKLFGYMLVPEAKRLIQGVKAGSYSEKESIHGMAMEIIENMQDGTFYAIGPGTTTQKIMKLLGLPNTLLGVDVVCGRKLIASDVNERQLYDLLKGEKAVIVITVIGGQGHIFGRGNQQLSPRIIRLVGRENIKIIASKDKLIALRGNPFIVDTGDESLDAELRGYYRVITGHEQYMPYKAI